jgi:hypothetical protein
MNDLLEIVARSSGSTLPSLGNILFVSETGSTTQNRADGLGRIDKPFKLQRAFDVAQPNDIIIIYKAIPFTNYSVSVNQLHIFMYCDLITINFNNTSAHQIYCYNIKNSSIFIKNIVNARVNVFTKITLNLTNCNSLNVFSEQECDIEIEESSNLNNCTFKSNIKKGNFLLLEDSLSFSNLNIDNFLISGADLENFTFTNCTFNKCIFSPLLFDRNNITNCFFYDSRINLCLTSSSSSLNFKNNKFVRCLINFTSLSPTSLGLNGNSTTNKFIDCVLFRSNNRSVRIENTTWILKDCTIHNPNPLTTLPNLGFFNVTGTCNLYLIDCKYEVPASSPYAISNNYTGELQLINCQLPTNITGGKTPTITSNVFIGTLPNINDVLDNI